jgi:hypothetical protein
LDDAGLVVDSRMQYSLHSEKFQVQQKIFPETGFEILPYLRQQRRYRLLGR